MPHPITVSRAVATERLLLAREMRKVLSLGSCISFTADMWTGQYKQTSYLTITVHWISEDCNLVSRVLNVQNTLTARRLVSWLRCMWLHQMSLASVVDFYKF